MIRVDVKDLHFITYISNIPSIQSAGIRDVLALQGVIVTDKNAARECWFKPVDEGLPLLNREEIYASFWLDDDYWEQESRKGIKCAEILVPEHVEPRYIIGAYVANQTALDAFKRISDLQVEIKRSLFF
ncbi:MAG: hypothetical protein A3D87_04830 [Omnitrophica WOR_2 bacterium RIFCSPHIGHO2_02_FULL_50_17]|nr:MAG: hypothetical protein A3D87_04830 [Omnitrophica WOR_2 bacterium RIFCSPHIGHO2_02_FULL_50_17]